MAKLEVGQIFPDIEVDLLYEGKKNIKEVFDADKTVIWCLRYVGCTVCRYDIHLAQQKEEGNDADYQASQPPIHAEEIEEGTHEAERHLEQSGNSLCDAGS